MSQEHDWQYDLDEYIRQGESDCLEKVMHGRQL